MADSPPVSQPLWRVLGGLALALALALPAMVPVIAGIETWKIVLAALGAILFAAGSRRTPVS